MTWEVVLTDRAGNARGELREAGGRSFKKTLSRGRSAKWTIQADNPLARWHTDDTTRAKWYDNGTLRFNGPLASFEKNRDQSGGSIAVTAGDPFAVILPKRLLGKTADGVSYASAVSPQDKGALAGLMLADANAAGDTGIRLGNVLPSSTGYAGPYRYQKASEAIASLSAGLGGFDWDLVPTEPTPDTLGLQIGQLDIYAAQGGVRDDVSFEFGTRKANVASWREIGDPTGNVNSGYALPPGFPDNATASILTQSDAGSIATRGLLEEVIDTGDLEVDQLRQALLDQNIAVRKQTRLVIAFQPTMEDPAGTLLGDRRCPRALTDYDVGDIVHFRAKERYKRIDPASGAVLDMVSVITVDALFRVFSIEIALDDNGGVTPTITLIMDT